MTVLYISVSVTATAAMNVQLKRQEMSVLGKYQEDVDRADFQKTEEYLKLTHSLTIGRAVFTTSVPVIVTAAGSVQAMTPGMFVKVTNQEVVSLVNYQRMNTTPQTNRLRWSKTVSITNVSVTVTGLTTALGNPPGGFVRQRARAKRRILIL